MLKIMIAVDGSEASLRATQSAIQSIAWYKQAPRIDLIAIHVSIPSVPHMGLVISQEMLDNYYREESSDARPQFERPGQRGCSLRYPLVYWSRG